MVKLSRREIISSIALTGLSSIAYGRNLLPASPIETSEAANRLLAYFSRIAPTLLRPPDGCLRYPSISPSLHGKAYSTQLWDWDTYWTSLGLLRLTTLTGNHALRERITHHAQGSLYCFLESQGADGTIPIMLSFDNRDFFGSTKHVPRNANDEAKPVMAQLALLVADELRSVEWLKSWFDHLIRFCDSWIRRNQSSIGLFVWGDGVAIGDDNDPTTFGRPFFSSANVLLNCLFYKELLAAAELARRLERSQDHTRLAAQARELGARIQQYCWDPRDKFYYTVDVQCTDRRAELIPNVKPGMPMSWKCLPLRIQMFTGFLPLWCELATQEQAHTLIQVNYLNDDRFRSNWGVRSLSSRETMYSLLYSSDPSNWLGPVWIIVNYFVWKALTNYGFQAEAEDIAAKTLRLLASDLEVNGSLDEYYHPDSGIPLSHHGFIDWNLLALEMI